MLYAVPKDDLLGGGDKKRVEIKKKDPAAPPLDRFPLPAVPDSVRQERRLALKDAQQKRVRLTKITDQQCTTCRDLIPLPFSLALVPKISHPFAFSR